MVQPIQQASPSAHAVVLGNEKGGTGKSITALHIVVALLKAGQRVATIDLDSRQKPAMILEMAVEEPRENTTPTKSEIPLNAADWEPGMYG